MKMQQVIPALALITCTIWCGTAAQTLIPQGATWRYHKGTEPHSDPQTNWLLPEFDDSRWPVGQAPFYYGEQGITGGTLLSDMRNRYTTVALRQKFYLETVPQNALFTLRYLVDDAIVLWINGTEVFRYNVAEGPVDHLTTASAAAPEPAQWQTADLTSYLTLLKSGMNQVCVLLINRSLTSSDILFDIELLLEPIDLDPPKVILVTPPPGSTVDRLTELTVAFSEPVQGIDPEDLLINGEPATEIEGTSNKYTFRFPQPPYGPVVVQWDQGHGITDRAPRPNPLQLEPPYDRWTYTLVDLQPPKVCQIFPEPGTVVRHLDRVKIWFSEPVQGVDPSDLLVNGRPCTAVEGILNGPYVFRFEPVPDGEVRFEWANDNGICDLSPASNRLEATPWTVRVDSTKPAPLVQITEILCSNCSSLKDEDGEASDWIEIHNPGQEPISLLGWSLSDDPNNPDLWTFPDVVLQPGQYIVVFASGKDRRDPTKPLHTNFKLGSDGEFLALFDNHQPRNLIHGLTPSYPEQRTDVSYGLDAEGQWRYFEIPTPGSPNTGPTLNGLTPDVEFSVQHGLFFEPFDLQLSCPDPEATIWYTLDGRVPSPETALRYTGPIRISSTCAIRACATSPGKLPSKVKTQTYIFPRQVIYQPKAPQGFPTQWGSERIITADYEMDPRIVNDPQYTEELIKGLLDIPSVSLVMPVDDWFSRERGIYSNASKSGLAWERAVSFELIYPDGRPGFQVDAGVRIQGGTSPINWKMQKLSLKLRFRADYGPRWLDFPVFPDSPIRRFDTLILDAHMNNTWAYGGGVSPEQQRERATYLHDIFTSDLQLATGSPAVHGIFVHLYINGLYWGLYELHEEPDEAFAAQYFGGTKDEYDVLKHTPNNVLNGDRQAWDALMQLVRSNVTDPGIYKKITDLIDIDAFIDYMLVHFYVGNTDWPYHNWYAIRRRTPAGKWHFISWDSEHVMETLGVDRTGVSDADSPGEIYGRLIKNEDFRLRFADRVSKHFSRGGIFYVDPQSPNWDPTQPQSNEPASRFYRRMLEIWSAVVCESARWGDNQRPEKPYTRNENWFKATGWLLDTFFPQRSQIVLAQLKNRGLIPQLPPPTLNIPGGRVAPGTLVSLTSPVGKIYYTLDGSDPRQPFVGRPAQTAKAYDGQPIAVDSALWIKARVYNEGQWSALTEAVFVADSELTLPLVPTEIMYNPPGGDPFEFIELTWLGSQPIDLSGYRFSGIDFQFPNGSILQPGQIIVLASGADPQAFTQRYPTVQPFGYFNGSLANGGEDISLLDAQGVIVWHVRYDDANGWAKAADGQGYSLELRSLQFSLSDPAAWRASAVIGGTPGQWEPDPELPSGLAISEVYPTGIDGDWVELVNLGDQAVDLGGWQLLDESDRPYALPPGLILKPNERLLIHCTGQTNTASFNAPFALNADGDSVILLDPLGRIADAVSFGLVPNGYSIGRDKNGQWVLCEPTPEAINSPAKVASPSALRLNELLADPPPGVDDWIEIFNPSSEPAPLHGLYVKVGTHLARFGYYSWIPANGFYLVRCDSRSDRHHLPTRLPGRGASLALLDEAGQPIDTIEYPTQTEGVSYGRLPDGLGPFQFLGALTPGSPNSNDPALTDLDMDRLPDAWELSYGLDPNDPAGDNGGRGDPDKDGFTNLQEYQAGTDPLRPDPQIVLRCTLTAQGDLQIQFQGSPGKPYRIEATPTLTLPSWKELLTNVAPPTDISPVSVTIPRAQLGQLLFLRVVRP